MSFIAAMDVGGTHARLALKPQGQSPLFFDAPGFTLHQNGAQEVARRCGELFSQALNSAGLTAGQCAALCCGAAGVDSEEDRAQYWKILQSLGFPNVFVWNDCELPLAEHPVPSVLIAAGTGSVVMARNAQGAFFRSGGWGFFTSDEGSACRLALDGLCCASRAWDGVCPSPVLTDLLEKEADLHTPGQAETFVRTHWAEKHRLAALAPLVCRAAQAGDPPARQVLERHAGMLAESAAAVARAAGLTHPPILLWGSLLTATDALRQPLIRALNAQNLGNVQLLKKTALESGLCLARRLCER